MRTTDGAYLLDLVGALERHGLFRSAQRVLDAHPDLHGQRVNSLRRRLRRNASARPISPGIYLLAVAGANSIGCVVPVRAERGFSRTLGEQWGWDRSVSEQVFRHTVAAVSRKALAPSRDLPELRLILPEKISLYGSSAALPAALACVEKWSGRRPPVPVLATGEMDDAGNILAVDNLAAKIEAALAELADCPGLVLFPRAQAAAPHWPHDRIRPVWTLEEAVKAVWSECPLAADPSLLSLETTLQEAQNAQDPLQALSILESHPTEGLPEADLARLLFATGCQCRHLGRSEEAAELHERARRLFQGREGAVGRQAVETFEMEAFATEMDLFALESLEPALRARLREPFLADHNEVRCRGTLAQLLSTQGRHDEAVRLRLSNVVIQKANEVMRQEIPRTLACLAYESARGGMAELFERTVVDLLETTTPGDSLQARYNLCAVARGLVLLGRHRELVDWGRNRLRLWGRSADPELTRLVTGEARLGATHPEVSTLRAVVRALRRIREHERAVELASGLELGKPRKDDLVYWLAALVEVEQALALNDSGRKEEAQVVIASAAEKLGCSHPRAARFYSALLSLLDSRTLDQASVEKIEIELDRVYY